MTGKIKYECSAEIWKHSAQGGWYFVTLPKEYSEEIRANLQWQEEGWGRMKATAQIGEQKWQTTIWYDTKHQSYILPIKSEIRKKEKLELNQRIAFSVWV